MTARLSISVSPALAKALEGVTFNRSAVCEAALWAAIRGETATTQLINLTLKHHDVLDKLKKIQAILEE